MRALTVHVTQVPHDKPKEALAMVSRWLAGEAL
jgi:hypothetical protein